MQKSPEAMRRFMPPLSEGRAEPTMKASVIEALMKHHFTANLQELDSLLWRAIMASAGSAIEWPSDTTSKSSKIRSSFRKDESSPGDTARTSDMPDPSEAEVRAALATHKGNIARMLHALGLTNRYMFYRLIRKYGINMEIGREEEG